MIRMAIGIGCMLMLGGCSSSWLPNMDLRMGGASLATAELRLESEPAGAEAKTSVGPACLTPCSLAISAPGDFTVTFTREGFLPQTQEVQLIKPTDLRVDPDTPTPRPSLSPNPVFAELEPAPPPARKGRNAKTRRPPTPQAPALR